uniref:Uncharacterized protein n=1 Tax=Mycena chlorophos TaxID=658473 RepID=A0ABQ0L739_MYCCL|nr:predicted protein [Mycena chlorophos]
MSPSETAPSPVVASPQGSDEETAGSAPSGAASTLESSDSRPSKPAERSEDQPATGEKSNEPPEGPRVENDDVGQAGPPKGKKRKPKDERLNKKNWTDGIRNEILGKYIERYGNAKRAGNGQHDVCLQKILHEYHFHIPWGLPDAQEPPLPLRPYDPHASLVDEDDNLTENEKVEKAEYMVKTKKRIKAWFEYRLKTASSTPRGTKLTEFKAAYEVLLLRLAGLEPPGRKCLGYQQLMRDDWHRILQPIIDREWAKVPAIGEDGKPKPRKPPIGFGPDIARLLWDDGLPEKLSQEQKDEYDARAERESEAAKKAWEEKEKVWPDPTRVRAVVKGAFCAGQMFACSHNNRAIDHAATMILPILEGLAEAAGVHALLTFVYASAKITRESASRTGAASLPPSECIGHEDDENDDGDASRSPSPPPTASSSRKMKRKAAPKQPATLTGTRTTSNAKTQQTQDAESSSGVNGSASSLAKILNDNSLVRLQTPSSDAVDESETETTESDGSEDQNEVDGKRKAKSQRGQGGQKRPKRAEETPEERSERELEAARAYEAQVARNKARNLKLLEELGLRHAAEGYTDPTKKPKAPRAPRKKRDEPLIPTRRSSRNTKNTDIDKPHAVVAADDAPAPKTDSIVTTTDDAPANPNVVTAVTPVDNEKEVDTAGVDSETVPMDLDADEADDEAGVVSHVPYPPDIADWLRLPWAQIADDVVHDDWPHLLRDFCDLERAYGWENNGALLMTSERPSELTQWVRNGRKAFSKTQIKNAQKFEQKWSAWWSHLQPAWRKVGDNTSENTAGDWGVLRAPGKNGLLLFVAGLFWWGKIEKTRYQTVTAAWVEAMTDVLVVLKEMLRVEKGNEGTKAV